jgi:Protein of unknown function (DUF2442)
MKFPLLRHIEAMPNFHLLAIFDDETETSLSFAQYLNYPIMQVLSTPEAFARVRLADNRTHIYWDVDVPQNERPDASSDWLYLQRYSPDIQAEFEKMLEGGMEWNVAAILLNEKYHQEMPWEAS